MRDMTFVDNGRDGQEVRITLWYPAAEAGQDAAPDLSGAPYPLVIYSHGGFYDEGSHRQDHSQLAVHLATHGIAVVGVDHDDEDRALAFVDRPLDVLFAINQLDDLGESDLTGLLDVEKIGVMGMSQGTATTLQMGGARLDREYTDTWCDSHPWAIPCNVDPSIPERGQAALAEVGVTDENGLRYIPSDPRIQAVALMAPCFAPIFGERGLAAVNTPALILVTTSEEACDYEEETVSLLYPHLGSADRYLISFLGYHHAYLLTPDDRVNSLMAAFFGYYLQDRQDYAPYLSEEYVNSLERVVWGVYQSP
jgi:predicted dienelactone hydrolase